MLARFGVGGFPPAFYETEFRKSKYGKHREGIFPWLKSLGLNWLELECTYGVKMPHDQAIEYGRQAKENGIGLSIHAPYYCVLDSKNPEIRNRSKSDLIACFDLASLVGATRVVFHPGYPSGNTSERFKNGISVIIEALISIRSYRPENLFICPETAGKRKAIGHLDHIIDICQAVDYARPCLDLAHIQGVHESYEMISFGEDAMISKYSAAKYPQLNCTENIVEIFNRVENALGRGALEESHFHVYPVESDHNGEKRHLAFFDKGDWYPKAEHFIEAIKIKKLTPTVVCEARNSQEHGAMLMKLLYESE